MRYISLLMLVIFCQSFTATAQFVVLNPGVAVPTVNDIKSGKNGQVIFATDNGVLIYQNNIWKQLLPGSQVKSLASCNGGFLYGATGGRRGFCDYTQVKEDTITSPAFNYIGGISINSLGDTLWGTDNGLVFANTSSGQVFLDAPGLFSTTIGATIGIVHIYKAGIVNIHGIPTTDKTVFFAPDTAGAALLTQGNGLLSDKALSHALDDMVYYIGTDAGISYADFSNGILVTPYDITKANTPLLPSDTISALAVVNDNLYIGTPKGLAVRVKNKWKVFNTSNSNIPSNDVTRLAFDITSQALWGATGEGQIFRIGYDGITDVESELKMQTISVFPDPAYDIVNFSLTKEINGVLHIFDVDGKLVATKIFNGRSCSLSVTSMATGIYSYKVSDRRNGVLLQGRFIVSNDKKE